MQVVAQTSLRQRQQENELHVGQPCYLSSLIDDEHWAGSLAVDSADHNYLKLQHEGQLSLCCLGSPVVDGLGVGSLAVESDDYKKRWG